MSHLTWDRGVHLPGHGLWLDPDRVRSTAFISHAHADHTRRHALGIMTAATWRLTPLPRRPRTARILGFGEPTQVGGATVTLYAAGHLLGSAQALIEHEGRRILYTGDLRLRSPGGPTPIPEADVLVVESTYGRPHFLFPDPPQVIEKIARWCRLALDAGITPVLLGHALGKAQELMLELGRYGFSFSLEPRCLPFAAAYRELGVELPDHVLLEEGSAPGRVVIAPPAGKDAIRRLRRYRVALISGWALEDRFWRRFGADIAFPYSDHGDFEELVRVAALSKAGQVYTVHGFAEDLARHLRKRGFRASPLAADEQLELGIA